MSHWMLLVAHAAGTEGTIDTTRRVLSSRHSDEGAAVVLSEPQLVLTRESGHDTWNREAECLRHAAARAGYALDADELLLLDVYELRALRLKLERAGPGTGEVTGEHRRPLRWGALSRIVLGARNVPRLRTWCAAGRARPHMGTHRQSVAVCHGKGGCHEGATRPLSPAR